MMVMTTTSIEEEGTGSISSSICSICLEVLFHQPSSSSSPAPSSSTNLFEMRCRCLFHFDCIVQYVQSRLQDRELLRVRTVRNDTRRGILCPNTYSESCACLEGYLIDYNEFLLMGAENRANEEPGSGLTSADLAKINKWIFEAEESVDGMSSSEQVIIEDPLLQAITKPCPVCAFRATHAHGHGCHHISPYGGCRECRAHFCYRCLNSAQTNKDLRSLIIVHITLHSTQIINGSQG